MQLRYEAMQLQLQFKYEAVAVLVFVADVVRYETVAVAVTV